MSIPIGKTVEYDPNQPISHQNHEWLVEYAGRIWEDLKLAKKEENSSWWAGLSHYFPSVQTVGANLGYAGATVHGPEMSNHIIDFIVSKCFSKPTQSQTYWQSLRNRMNRVAEKSVAESAKLAFTPFVLPTLQTTGYLVGGIALPVLVDFCSKWLARPKQLHSLREFSIEELVTVNKEGVLVDKWNQPLTEEDLQALKEEQKTKIRLMMQYDLVYKLSQKDVTRGEAVKILESYRIKRFERDQPDQATYVYLNGEMISQEQNAIIEKGIKGIKTLQITQIFKAEMEKMIELLTEHLPHPDTLSPASNSYKNLVVKCSDGAFCVRKSFDDKNVGDILTKEEVEVLQEKERKQIEEIEKDFIIIDVSKEAEVA